MEHDQNDNDREIEYRGVGMTAKTKTDTTSTAKTARRLLMGGVLASFCGAMVVLGAGPIDPGPRGGVANVGGMIAGMTSDQISQFPGYKNVFFEVNNQATLPVGLGPGYDADNCSVCHAQPAMGGSSPATNPLFSQYQLNGATNIMPSFITTNGPILNARSPLMPDGITPDGHVQQLFVITGRSDATGCNATQPNFAAEIAASNLSFRQTTPLFGLGLMEIVQNSDILANMNANLTQKQSLGISGHPSIAGDGSIGRFGWKAQGRSLISFSGEAYNIEEGITNELSPNELNQTPGCDFNGITEDHTNFTVKFVAHDFDGDPEDLANFMRFLAPPTPVGLGASSKNGQTLFNTIGCSLCHTPSFTTPPAAIAALNKIQLNPLSDMLVHHMGSCLADNIVQGNVAGDEFRTAPLWGVGKRIFFMHDGRETDIGKAILDHSCGASSKFAASEANAVIAAYSKLPTKSQQDLVNYLRSL